MKYVLRFELKGNEIKSDYRPIIVSYFKKAISEYMEGRFFHELYDGGATHKNLTWSVRLSKPKFMRDYILLGDNKIDVTIKIDDINTALIFYSALLEMKHKFFNIGNGNQMTLRSIHMVKDAKIMTNFAVFKILSPICLRQHQRQGNVDHYVSIGDDEFLTELNRKLKEDIAYMQKEVDELEYDLNGLRKVIVPVYGLLISATIGTLIIKGDPRILNHVKNSGIGSRRNSGFGLLDVITTF